MTTRLSMPTAPEQFEAHQHSSSELSESAAKKLSKQIAPQTDLLPVAPTVILWRSLMLQQ